MSTRTTSRELTPGRSPGRQLRVLEALDQARVQYYHVSAVLIAGMGFFTDAYDLFVVALVTRLLGRIYFPYNSLLSKSPGQLPFFWNLVVLSSTLVGAVIGQILFGWLGDKLGRKRAYGMTLGMMFIFSLASGLSIGNSPSAVLGSLCFFRFWLGVGIGGDYPLSATIMSEYANTETRGAFIAAVFAMQGFGILSGGCVGVIFSAIFNAMYRTGTFADAYDSHSDTRTSTATQADYLWRLILMVGAIPAAATFYYRMRMPETARYTALVTGDTQKATLDMMTVLRIKDLDFSEEPTHAESAITVYGTSGRVHNDYKLLSRTFLEKHGLELLGTAATWFLLDITYYSQTLFQTKIFRYINWTPPPAEMNGIEEVFQNSKTQLIVALCGALPGYFVCVFLVDRLGRFVIQLQGFIFMAIFMFSIAISYDKLVNGTKPNIIIFLVLYSFTFFFANFGPNTTTFIIPAELFPARFRATCHGISAAAGKLGALIGVVGFAYASQPRHPNQNPENIVPRGIGLKNSLYILAALNFLAMAFTFLIPETKGRSLEEISGESKPAETSIGISVHPNIRGLGAADRES